MSMSNCSSSCRQAVERSRLVAYSDSDSDSEEDAARSPPNWHLAFEGIFSYGVIEEAIRVCGSGASEEALVDFMLALQHAPVRPEEPAVITESITSPSANGAALAKKRAFDPSPAADGGSEVLRNMGFTTSQIFDAIASCGVESTVEAKIAYILNTLQHGSCSQPADSDEDESTHVTLTKLGYAPDQALKAIDACGSDAEIDVLVDFIDAHGNLEDDSLEEADDDEEEDEVPSSSRKRRREEFKEKITSGLAGFSLPGQPIQIPRTLRSEQQRRPFFYFENVRGMPKGEWAVISRFLYDIQPEFVCASKFSVSRRPRGYVHNIPLENRRPALPVPPQTIREFLPGTVRHTPAWDTREKLSTINTGSGGVSFANRIRDSLTNGGPLTEEKKKEIMYTVKKWNLVWTGPNSCSPLEAHEMERALGFDEYHTRGFNVSERHKSLGNAFQTDVVAYHLSPLKALFPDGIRVLSLFSGIGGAEVALHRAGIRLKYVTSVECRAVNQKILERWWTTSGQTGKHRILDDVQDLTKSKLQELMKEAGGPFDLVIGGSPCNNLSGNNRVSRTGLEGDKSSMFYEFPRVVNLLRTLTDY